MFFALQLDRGNIVQANSDNMLSKLAADEVITLEVLTPSRGPRAQHERLQQRHDHILLFVLVRGTPVADHWEKAWTGCLDPYSDDTLERCGDVASRNARKDRLLHLPLVAWNARRR